MHVHIMNHSKGYYSSNFISAICHMCFNETSGQKWTLEEVVMPRSPWNVQVWNMMVESKSCNPVNRNQTIPSADGDHRTIGGHEQIFCMWSALLYFLFLHIFQFFEFLYIFLLSLLLLFLFDAANPWVLSAVGMQARKVPCCRILSLLTLLLQWSSWNQQPWRVLIRARPAYLLPCPLSPGWGQPRGIWRAPGKGCKARMHTHDEAFSYFVNE